MADTDLAPASLPGAELADTTLAALDAYCRGAAADYRACGGGLDRDPDDLAPILDLRGVRFAQYGFLPPAYRPALELPPSVVEAARTCLGGTLVVERLSYGDPGVVLASPGPSLSGGVIKALADEKQADRYHRRVAEPGTHTFFGLTEPGKGSAATELETALTPAPDGDGWLLDGEKRYIGNGCRAEIGVVFCRRAPGPLGVEAVLLDTATPGVYAEPLPMMGLRGARISRMRFDGVRVAPENLLGAELPRSRRGLRGALHILYRFRPGIAGMALACAQAVCDHIRALRPSMPAADRSRLAEVIDRTAAVRRLTYRTAADVDRGHVNVHRIGSVKIQAAELAEQATLLAAELLGPTALVDDPWLEKVYRDVRGFELMEGTTNLHQLAVFQGVLRGTFLPDPNTPVARHGGTA